MFKQLFSALKSGDVVDQAFADFAEMIEHAEWMFLRASAVIGRTENAEEVRDAIYGRDQQINGLLRGIRRKIVRHLTINPGGDVAARLALMSVAKDAERIGDYCKNLYEVGRFYTEDFRVDRYQEPIESVHADVERLFDVVRRAWGESDHKLAREAITIATSVRHRCNDLIENLLGDEANVQMHEAVAYSLLTRHYKRVAAHLANISTAVLGRIEDLDFER